MESLFFDATESSTDATLSGDQQSDFNTQAFSATPGDDDDSEDQEEDNEEDNEEDKSSSGSSDDGNPPLDKEIVHSPVTTKTGGKPK